MKDREIPEWIPLKEFAGLCGVHYQTALRWVSAGEVESRKSGGKWEVSGESYRIYADTDGKWITVDQAADVAGRSPATIRAWIDSDDDMKACVRRCRTALVPKRQTLVDRDGFAGMLAERKAGKAEDMKELVESLSPLGGYGKPATSAQGNGGGGNSRVYLVRRLKRDAPDIAKKLANGEYPSVRAAVEAARKSGKINKNKKMKRS